MIITGYRLQNAIREEEHIKNAIASQWDDSLHVFPGDGPTQATPGAIMEKFRESEARLAKLQVAQARYNLAVRVEVVGGVSMTLCEAVKRVGGAGRAEKMWRSAASGEKKDPYRTVRDLTRKSDEERAVRTVSVEDALREAKAAARFAASLREAIQTGNAQEVEIEDLAPSLFE